MARTPECQLCYRRLDAAQALRFLVETENLDDPAYLDHIRQLPAVGGRPMCVCKTCQSKLENRPRVVRRIVAAPERRQFRSAVMTALGFLTIGWVVNAVLGD